VTTLVFVYVALVLVLPLVLSAFVSYRALPRGRRCARCGAPTLRLQDRVLDLVGRLLPARLTRRWCMDCGWEAVARAAHGPASRRPARRTDTDLEHGGSRTVDVRWLIVDGVAWRVRLEYWLRHGGYCGRLVFVSPAGRDWMDAQPLSASSDRALLRHALTLSDRLLASRLRELVSD
jgi:hypothetical protein